MCTTCGCSGTILKNPETQFHQGEHHHHDGHHNKGEARLLEVERDLLERNDKFAQQNRDLFSSLGVKCFNLVSSPGSGKTSLLTKTLTELPKHIQTAVIEGDQQTERDAERIRSTGTQAIQINTGKGCHLEAHGVGHALEELELKQGGIIFVENVGNLVCPAAFDLGEQAKVVLLSVTEGEDKPLKYPDMFRASSLMIINKLDLLPYVEFDVDLTIEYARRINPDINVIQLSATTGEGFDNWLAWLQGQAQNSEH